jgi:hypothetical protein
MEVCFVRSLGERWEREGQGTPLIPRQGRLPLDPAGLNLDLREGSLPYGDHTHLAICSDIIVLVLLPCLAGNICCVCFVMSLDRKVKADYANHHYK